mgnify:CR=1 FL=1
MKKIHILPTIVLSLFVLGIFFTQVNTFTSNTQHATTLKSDIAVPLSGDQLNARVASLPPPTEKVFLMGGSSATATNTLNNEVWTSSDGTSWILISPNQQNGNSKWSPRISFGAIYFDNKIWVAGGVDSSSYKNDVWSSPDGIIWTKVINNAPWSPRISHTILSYNSKIWIIGGDDGNSGMGNDVWSSPDGISWTQETNTAPWSVTPWGSYFGRSGHTSLVFDNKMWVIGGDVFGVVKNDVWSSIDGINWTQVSQNTPWQARSEHASVIFNNKIWVSAGNDYNTPFLNTVWSSLDGINWTQFPSTLLPSRSMHQMYSLNGSMFILGGNANNPLNDEWKHSNTGNWILQNLTPNPLNIGKTSFEVITTPLSFGLPDIIVTDLKWQEPIAGVPIGPGHNNPISQSTSNKYILFTATIKNDSAVPLAIPANHKMKLFSGTAPSVLAVNNINFGTSVTIPPQGTHTFNFSSQATPNMRATAGTYTLTLRADTSNVVVEKNENNNRIVKTLVIQ